MTYLTVDEAQAAQASPGRLFTGWRRVVAGGGRAWRAVTAELTVWEWISAVGIGMLFAGLVVWFGPGPALTVVGGLVLVLGIAGGRAAAQTAPHLAGGDERAG